MGFMATANFSGDVSGASVIEFHDAMLRASDWPRELPSIPEQNVWHWIAQNHRNNSLLWDEEDLARRTLASDADITANKRAIDRYNQARNDATERVDEYLLLSLGLIDPATVGSDQPKNRVLSSARLNSETAGSMIDRMSIMSLKVRAMTAQTTRSDVDQAHRDGAIAKLARLHEQRLDLATCLDQLLGACRSGVSYFKVYRQFKMYNDPRFNPVLVAERQAMQSSSASR
jgi:hypothetical protein